MYSSSYTTKDHPRTAQAIYDAVKAHGLKQGRQSLRTYPGAGPSCAYRGSDDDTACFGGCLLPGSLYNPEMEGAGWMDLWDLEQLYDGHMGLIADLQQVHDNADEDFIPQITAGLARVATEHGLAP